MMAEPNKLNKAIASTLAYYDLLDKPFTALEIFKYLRITDPGVSFFDLRLGLKELSKTPGDIEQRAGLYFLPGRREIINIRAKRLKFSQIKWKKLKKIGRYLALSPFLRMAAVTGSLTAYNAKRKSDFDLLIVLKKNRLWLGRLLLTGLIGALGQRRHGTVAQDKICLNCYLTENNLEITRQAKPRDFHAAQEYGRLIPLIAITPGIYAKFIAANGWLAQFLKNYPWPNEQNSSRVKPSPFFTVPRRVIESLLDGKIGNKLENFARKWQTERINKKLSAAKTDQDQIYISDHCLMFHPQSKSDKLMKEFELRMKKLQI